MAHASLYSAALLGIGCYLTKFSLSRGFFLLLFAVGVPPCSSAGTSCAGSSTRPVGAALSPSGS